MDNLTLLCDPCNRLKSNKPTLHELCIERADEGRMGKGWYEDEKRKMTNNPTPDTSDETR